jgi:hypothetical protein
MVIAQLFRISSGLRPRLEHEERPMKLRWSFVVNGNASPLTPYDERQQQLDRVEGGESEPEASVALEACDAFEEIIVKTLRHVYEIVVLSSRTGAVLVRGGDWFPEFRRATLIGSTRCGRPLRVRCVEAESSLAFLADGNLIRTSRVQSVVRASTSS